MFSNEGDKFLTGFSNNEGTNSFRYHQTLCEFLRTCLDIDGGANPIHQVHVVEKTGNSPSRRNQYTFKVGDLLKCLSLNFSERIFSFFSKKGGNRFSM